MTASATCPIIEVEGLTYEYPGVRALDGVSLRVPRGSVTALVGPNGAGKTTLLRCLAGLDTPLTGRIRVAGIDVIEAPRRSHTVMGYLPDTFGLYDALPVRRGLAYVAAANGVPATQRMAVVTRTAAELGLTDHLERNAGTLSRGLRQRVAIAQAIIHAPRVILLDEPATGLDPGARLRLGELFRALGQRGLTLLVSSHILAELATYATDMLVMEHGHIVEQCSLRADAGRSLRLEIEITTAVAPALATLAAQPGVQGVRADGAVLRCDFVGAVAERALLLEALVTAGIGVARFAPANADLQASYLHSLGGEDRPA